MRTEDRIETALATAGLDVIVVPGLNDSGSDHWQSQWCARFPDWKRVSQSRWDRGDLEGWMEAITASLARCTRPALLVAHSFGALASAGISATIPDRIAAALLVAPASPSRFGLEERLPRRPLPVPTLLLASRNDPWLAYPGAEVLAQRWGSRFVDLGHAGHVNAESGLGAWPEGLELLSGLIEEAVALPGARPPHRSAPAQAGL